MSPSVSVRLLLTQGDARLVQYARAGHERAFEALVQRYRRPLHSYCRRLLLSDERAEDALQQALLQAWVALRDGAEVRDARAWLYRIVHNAAVNALRVSGYDYCTLSETLSGADAPQDDLDRRIAVREALAGLAALPEMQREALLRTAVEGRSHQQVATDLGLSETAVRGLVYRARAAMRAAAGAIVPPPLIGWALEAGTRGAPALERVANLGAGGGSAGLAGLIVKGGAVAVSAGALAGGLVVAHAHRAQAHATAHPRSAHSATGDTGTAKAGASDAGASVRPTAFTRPADHGVVAAGRPGRTQSPRRLDSTPPARRHRSFAPPPILTSHPHDGNSGQSGGSHDGHAGNFSDPGSGAGAGAVTQHDGGPTSHDGGGSHSGPGSGQDGSSDSGAPQPSGGEASTAGGGGDSSSSKDGGSNTQPPTESQSEGGATTSTSGSKDSAGARQTG